MKKPLQYLVVEKRGPAFWIFFNRPEAKNALNLEMADEFLRAVREGTCDRETSVLVISGKGEAFSAGGDIKLMSTSKNLKGFFLKISKIIHTSVQEIRKSEKPVIAAIPGYVGGIAFGLIQSADLLIASTNASFCAATIRLGLVANGSATYFLPRRVGFTRAAEILYLGDTFSAEEALKAGFINWVVPHEILEQETQEVVEQLASAPRKALGRLKKILNASLTSTLSAQLERERQAIAWSATTEDFREGMKAFLEKRKPVFNQK